MKFERHITNKLEGWSKSTYRKPLIIRGARQVGKTTIVSDFGKRRYGQVAYFNFEKRPELKDFFKTNLDPHRLIDRLGLVIDININPNDTLIFLDEIQECPEAITALKYFCEDAPEYAVIAAGSLLGVAQQRSFPVGKVEFLDLFPLSYEEFLQAIDSKLHKAYRTFIDEGIIQNIPLVFFDPLLEKYKEYIICGGMPEVVKTYIESGSIEEAKKIKQQILDSYARDFSKHVDHTADTYKIGIIWDSLPSQLARENKKFIYGVAKQGARAREYENAIQWLTKAGLVLKVHEVEELRIPIKAMHKLSAFKLYMLDTGLLFGLSGLDHKQYLLGNNLFKEFKGALIENYVAQSLVLQGQGSLQYWNSAGKAEIDFLIQKSKDIIPIEVKSGDNPKSKSMKIYKEKHKPRVRVRLSPLNLTLDGDLLNVPLFYTDHVETFIENTGLLK